MSASEPDLSFLDNYDEDDLRTPLVKELRKQVDRLAKASKKAHEDGKTEALQEFQTQQARDKALADVPAILRDKFADIDPTDQASIDVRKQQLQAGGVTWGQPADTPPPPPAHEAPDPSLDRMQQAAAGGQSPGNEAGDRAQRIQRDLEAGRSISDEDVDWFANPNGYANTLIREAGKRPGM